MGACEVIALGGAGDQTWRAKPSPVNISADADYIAAVDGIAYFLSVGVGGSSRALLDVAMFDLATEEWRPAVLRGPPSSHMLTKKRAASSSPLGVAASSSSITNNGIARRVSGSWWMWTKGPGPNDTP